MLKTKSEIKELFEGVKDEVKISIKITALFDECKKIEDLKQYYKILALMYHPDVSGFDSTEIFKLVGNMFDDYINKLKNPDNEFVGNSQMKDAEIFKDIINKIINFENLDIEVIGIFIWLTFDKKPNQDILTLIKDLKFKWHKKDKKWYWHPDWYTRRWGKKVYSMDEKRSMYGSEKVKTSTSNQGNYTKRKKKQLTFTRVYS